MSRAPRKGAQAFLVQVLHREARLRKGHAGEPDLIFAPRPRPGKLDFDYERPPQPAAPNHIVHYQKMAFNKVYWYLVPTGIL